MNPTVYDDRQLSPARGAIEASESSDHRRTPSILFPPSSGPPPVVTVADWVRTDLNVDQIIDRVIAGRDDYGLAEFLLAPISDTDTVRYRQAAFTEFDDAAVSSVAEHFAESMRHVRSNLTLAARLRHPRQQQLWQLDAAHTYCTAVLDLTASMPTTIESAALGGVYAYLVEYVRSPEFSALNGRTRSLLDALDRIEYEVLVRDTQVSVGYMGPQSDYTAEVATCFERFTSGRDRGRRLRPTPSADLDRVEGKILDRVAKLFPETFEELEAAARPSAAWIDPGVALFDREAQFYLKFLRYLEPLRARGLQVCYPLLSPTSRRFCAVETFDLALADMLVRNRQNVVGNDMNLADVERVFVVSGPNQGGKTTFARTVGQLHYLAALGCPVPGRRVELSLPDQICSVFGGQEDPSEENGGLADELERVHTAVTNATSQSVIILNEAFTSTSAKDALFLGEKVLGQIIAVGALCVFVTFLEELSRLGEGVVSMVSAVGDETPASRTYKVVRRRADGRAYAMTIAQKYGLTYDAITSRMSR